MAISPQKLHPSSWEMITHTNAHAHTHTHKHHANPFTYSDIDAIDKERGRDKERERQKEIKRLRRERGEQRESSMPCDEISEGKFQQFLIIHFGKFSLAKCIRATSCLSVSI